MRCKSRVLLALALLPVTSSAQHSWPLAVSANVAIATDYVFRGVSETRENPAIQGGFDASYPIGPIDIFAGVWASNVDFGDEVEEDFTDDLDADDASDADDEIAEDTEADIDSDEDVEALAEVNSAAEDVDAILAENDATTNNVSGAQAEFDIYGGFSGNIPLGSGLSWDAGVVYYIFPGASSSLNYDFLEGFVGLGYTFLGLPLLPEVAAKVYYSPDYSAATGQAIYAEGSTDFSLPYDTKFGLYVGYQTIEDNAFFGLPDYLNWRVTLSKEVLSLNFALSYVDTNVSSDECFGGTSLCDPRPLFSVSKEF